VVRNEKVLPVADTRNLITQSLRADEPATIHFTIGRVLATVQKKPYDASIDFSSRRVL
jgi:hypothetical protein